MSTKEVVQFREQLYATFTKRAGGAMNLIDALASAARVESPVGLSLSGAFKRGFSSVYDTLNESEIKEVKMNRLLHEGQPAMSETIAGYEALATDATDEPRASAKTLADRTVQKSDARAAGVAGHKYQWLVRLVTQRKSWVAAEAVDRVKSGETANDVAARQMRDLDRRSSKPKVVIADSGYANRRFLAVFVGLLTVVVLVRLRCNQTLYGSPAPREIRGHTVILQAWTGLHLKTMADLGRHSGAGHVPEGGWHAQVQTPAVAVLDRIVEHGAARHLGWNPRTPVPVAVLHRALLPLHETAHGLVRLPRQVQLAMPSILDEIGTPASLPRPSGKAPGRAKSFRPRPRPRYPIVYKSAQQSKRVT